MQWICNTHLSFVSVSEQEASASQYVKLNGHHNHHLNIVRLGEPKQQKLLHRQPIPTRLFLRLTAGVAAALAKAVGARLVSREAATKAQAKPRVTSETPGVAE